MDFVERIFLPAKIYSMHKNILSIPTLLTAIAILTSFGINIPSTANAAEADEEICEGSNCSEEEINAPLPEFAAEEEFFEPSFDNISKYSAPAFDASWGLKRATYEKAVAYYNNSRMISNPRYMVVIDFSQHSSKKRLYLFDMNSGSVERYLTAHGKGSDHDNDGFAHQFSNVGNSKASSLGFYITLGTYRGKHGTSLRIKGLSGTNSNAERRGVVFHGAGYVRPGMNKLGRSWGCPAMENRFIGPTISKIKGGALVYIDN